jgi:L-fuconolactonase
VHIVDSHAHVALNWYEPIETLNEQMRRNGVARAVLTQPLGQTDNAYIQACRRREPQRYATIVLVDPADPGAVSHLAQLVEDGASGVRLRPSARSAGADALAIWRAAQDLGIAVSSPGTSADFASDEFADLVAALPGLTIVIEHLGAGNAPDTTDEQRARRRTVFALARFPNVVIKVPGLGEIAPRASDRNAPFPFERAGLDVLDEALAAFGPQRLMWGSDFPIVCSREGYAGALRFCMDAFGHRSEGDRELIFGGVADRVFPSRP